MVCVQGCLSVPDALPPDQLGALRELLTEMQIKCVDGTTQKPVLPCLLALMFWRSDCWTIQSTHLLIHCVFM